MRKLTLLAPMTAVAAVLTLSAPAFAQTAPTPAPAPQAAPAEPTTTPEEAAFEEKAEVFSSHIQTMAGEMQAVVTASGSDAAKKKADLDAIQAKYQPEVDAFATELEAFAGTEIAAAPEDKRAEMQAKLTAGMAQLRSLPAMMRAQMEQAAAAAPAPAPAQ